MPLDRQDSTMTQTAILPDLLTLTKAAVAPTEALLDQAKSAVRDTVTADGRISGALLEQHQAAAHGLS